MSHEYFNLRRQFYGDDTETASYIPVCPHCGRFVKADKQVKPNSNEPNATCKKCGRVEMPFEGYF